MPSSAHDEWRSAKEVDLWGFTFVASRQGDAPWRQYQALDLVRGGAKSKRSVEDAAAIVWTLTSPEVHRLLRADRGWSSERFRDWLGETLARTLLT